MVFGASQGRRGAGIVTNYRDFSSVFRSRRQRFLGKRRIESPCHLRTSGGFSRKKLAICNSGGYHPRFDFSGPVVSSPCGKFRRSRSHTAFLAATGPIFRVRIHLTKSWPGLQCLPGIRKDHRSQHPRRHAAGPLRPARSRRGL